MLEGWAINHSYDGLGRRSGTSLTHGASTPYAVAYGYDEASRLASITKGLNAVAYNYHDDSSRVWQQTFSHDSTETFKLILLR